VHIVWESSQYISPSSDDRTVLVSFERALVPAQALLLLTKLYLCFNLMDVMSDKRECGSGKREHLGFDGKDQILSLLGSRKHFFCQVDLFVLGKRGS
jgi:hypothetical protein